jgi:hypothetical protein
MFFCDKCKKEYSSYNSLWLHNKKYHVNKDNVIQEIIINDPNSCIHCNKISKNKYLLQKHLTRCSIKKFNDRNKIEDKDDDKKLEEVKLQLKLEEVKLEEIKLEVEKIKLEQMKIELKLKTKKSTKTNIKNINNLLNSNNTTNNNVINNFQIIACGKEQLIEALTENEKKSIIRSRFSCLEKIVDIVHCGKYNQYPQFYL